MDVNVCNPLLLPYRTGSYLIYDVDKGDVDKGDVDKEEVDKGDVDKGDKGDVHHFRSAWDYKLGEHRYRASGSRQLDLGTFIHVLGNKVVAPHKPSQIYLVDLREETHGFLDGRAVSWYADNDFANVGQSLSWIMQDEQSRLATLQDQKATQVFNKKYDVADDRGQERVAPVSYTDVVVGKTYTEATAAEVLTSEFNLPVIYHRVPVTDHCAPTEVAISQLTALFAQVRKDPQSWVHFHCHGGDGRTTTFLALLDMLWWKKSKDPLPPLTDLACRQCALFQYCLNPDGCRCANGFSAQPVAGWKRPLADVRWAVLEQFRQKPSDAVGH